MKFRRHQGKVLFQRVGPMSGQTQDNPYAPSRKGIWVFPWPFFDWFFVSGEFSAPARGCPYHKNMPSLDQVVEELELDAEAWKSRQEAIEAQFKLCDEWHKQHPAKISKIWWGERYTGALVVRGAHHLMTIGGIIQTPMLGSTTPKSTYSKCQDFQEKIPHGVRRSLRVANH